MDLKRLLDKKIVPRADRIDCDRRALVKGFKILGRKRLLDQKNKLSPAEYFTFKEQMQACSGALGFLQRQHQAAGAFIGKSALKEEWLPLMERGKRRVGISISHMRTQEAPCIRAVRSEEGWLLSGKAFWVSGYRLFDWLVIGFFCPEENVEGFGLIPFKRSRTLKVGGVIETVAMRSMQTVTLELKNFALPDERVLFLQPIGTFGNQNDPLDVHFVNLSAIARGFLDEYDDRVLREAYEKCRNTYVEQGVDLTLYAEMHKIATQLSLVARLAAGTRSVVFPNAIERRTRELMLYSVILPSKEIAQALIR